MLNIGSSVSWPETVEKLTGQRKMDTTVILQYFKPLPEQNYMNFKDGHLDVSLMMNY